MVAGSASSTVSSASARAMLLAKLNQLWTALSLGTLSALTTVSGKTDGFTLTASTVGASANATNTDGTGTTATVKQGQTLVVHTGIYADSNGNWTDDPDLAADLGLSEITYSLTNNDYTHYTTSATFKTLPEWSFSKLALNRRDQLVGSSAHGVFKTSKTRSRPSASTTSRTPTKSRLHAGTRTTRSLWPTMRSTR
jgi:hypothetical protein